MERTPYNQREVAGFQSDLSKANEDIRAAKFQNFIDVCMMGSKFVPTTIQMSVKFRDFLEQQLCLLWTCHH